MENQIQREDRARVKLKHELYQKYIVPYDSMIRWLCRHYSDHSSNVDDNYICSLTNLYKGIHTYDPTKPIKTWIHIVVRRCVQNLNKARDAERQKQDDSGNVEKCDAITCEDLLDEDECSWTCLSPDNYREFYNDDILAVLDSMKPAYREALILQQAGYALSEIADILYNKGLLKVNNVNTVKGKLFHAKKQLKNLITRDGERKID